VKISSHFPSAFSIPEFQDVRPVFALQFAERDLNPHFHLISGKTLDFFPLFVLEIMARRWRSSFVSVLISFFELFTMPAPSNAFFN
jgi:hypothetical protein